MRLFLTQSHQSYRIYTNWWSPKSDWRRTDIPKKKKKNKDLYNLKSHSPISMYSIL